MFTPKLVSVLREGYGIHQFTKDLTAGIIVGIVALPLAIAFAIASGVSPDKGLYTAIIGGFMVSVLGGSRVQIGGPTGAFIVIVYSIVSKYGVDGLIISTLMAGIILMILGFSRLGNVIKFIPYPLTVGFTSGIALLIFSSQVKDFLGLTFNGNPVGFLEKWGAVFSHLSTTNYYALALSVGTIVIIIGTQRLFPKIPGSLIAIILTTAAVCAFKLPVETIESRFGEIPTGLPHLMIPSFNWGQLQAYVQPAFAIALLGGIESLLSAVVADGMISGNHRSNMELVGQGVANISSALFGGIPVTGAIARTATNVKSGGRTPIAGIVHAITLLIIMLFAGKWAKLIPLSCLSGILAIVAFNMSEWRSFKAITRGSRQDITILIVTFLLTVIIDLTVAIEIGMVLACFLFMQRMAKVSHVSVITDQMEDLIEKEDPDATDKLNIPKHVEIYEVNGPFFFGAAHKFRDSIKALEKRPKIMIIRMRNVPFIDSTGIHNLRQLVKDLAGSKIRVILSGVQPDVDREIRNAGLAEIIGEEYIFPHIRLALEKATELSAQFRK
ncbi:MAG: sulfate permease [Bacteroidota bacterium]|nr:sulfate permease [Bacteroidota bacterium]